MTTRAQFKTLEEAARSDPRSGEQDLAAALNREDWDTAAAIALARAEAGIEPPPELVERLTPRVADAGVAAALMARASGDRLGLIVRLLEAGQMADERDVVALGLAIRVLRGAPPPEPLRLCMLELKYRPMDTTARMLRSAALEAAGQPPDAPAARALTAWLAPMDEPLASLYPEGRVTRTVSPIRKARQKVGRNDLCPCGSGLKYKKCHEQQDAEEGEPTVEVSLADEAPGMTAERVRDLRSMEVERLPLEKLRDDALLVALRQLVLFCRWPQAERALEIMGARPSLAHRIADDRRELVHYALVHRADEVALRQAARLPAGEPACDIDVPLALIGPLQSRLETIEKFARKGLEDELVAVDLAFALLRRVPALGVLVARGAVALGRPLENDGLLEELHHARERMHLPPEDLADELADIAEDRSSATLLSRLLQQDRKTQDDSLALRVEALSVEAREARERAAELERSLRIAERQVSRLPVATTTTEPEEVRALRNRVEELKRLVEEGNETRTRLRHELAVQETALSRTARVPADDPEDSVDREDVGTPTEAPARVLVPRFSDAARKSLSGLPRHVKASAVERAGALSAGRPAAWSGVKRMALERAIHSARLGLHHRMLFSLEGDDLVVADVIPRRELEGWLSRR